VLKSKSQGFKLTLHVDCDIISIRSQLLITANLGASWVECFR